MIRIRYRDFSAHADEVTWLYGRAERSGGGTVIYLQPGLTPAQRRAALRRLRQEASRDLGPPLPPVQLRAAIAVDRVRATFGTVGAVIRLHPAAALLPAALAALCVLAVAGGPGAGGSDGSGPGPHGGSRAAPAAGPALRPLAIVIVPAVSRVPAWYIRSRGLAACCPPLAFGRPQLTDAQPRRCSKPRTAP